MQTIALLGTCDTKLPELLYLRSQILSHPSTTVILIDVGRTPTSHPDITIGPSELLSQYATTGTPSSDPQSMDDLQSLPRNELVQAMSRLATRHIEFLYSGSSRSSQPSPKKTIHGIVSLGGSNATALATPVMRNALPIGFPKMMVSTVASGDTGPYVGETDITMMYSVVDVAGLNGVLKRVLGNAAGAVVGMARAYERRMAEREKEKEVRGSEGEGKEKNEKKKKVKVGITMFGVTTPGVDAVRQYLEEKYPVVETMVFHATGHGGKAMERLVRDGELDAVIDLTTTELADELVGGVMSAGPDRMRAAVEKGVPYVVSLGALDMVNFGPKATVPERFRKDKGRKLYEHNPTVTLLRTSAKECEEIGRMCERLRNGGDPSKIQVWIPRGGLSMLSVRGAPFEDSNADQALFGAVRESLKDSDILIKEDERDINDKGFAHDIAEAMARLLELSSDQQS